MFRSPTLSRALTGALVTAAFVAPAAQARPAEDMHSSVALGAAKAQKAQDLRSPDARDAGTAHPVTTVKLRSVAKAPTWPAHPQAIAVKPVATDGDTGSGGVDWASIGIGAAASFLVIGGIAALSTRRTRHVPRAHAGV